MAKGNAQGTQSIQRAALLMREVAAHSRQGIRLIDLARGLRLERPTIFRLLRSLIEEELITQDPRSKRYFLGEALFKFGLTAAWRFNPRDVCQPILERVAAETEDTVYLNMRSGNEAVCLDRKTGPFPVKVLTLNVGERRPLGAGAGGLAILSALSEEDMRAVIKEIDARRILHGKQNLTARKLLSAVRRTQAGGYAVHEGEVADVRAIGVAIKRKNGVPFAAISLTAVSRRVTERRIPALVTLLKQAALELEGLINDQDLSEWNI